MCTLHAKLRGHGSRSPHSWWSGMDWKQWKHCSSLCFMWMACSSQAKLHCCTVTTFVLDPHFLSVLIVCSRAPHICCFLSTATTDHLLAIHDPFTVTSPKWTLKHSGCIVCNIPWMQSNQNDDCLWRPAKTGCLVPMIHHTQEACSLECVQRGPSIAAVGVSLLLQLQSTHLTKQLAKLTFAVLFHNALNSATAWNVLMHLKTTAFALPTNNC